jgi:WD domain, G-beta repeat
MSDATAINPYVGPRAFEEGEGARFFGREREQEELFHLLLARRLVLLHAPSGAGKSSLVRAALIPRLRDEGFRVRPIIRVGAETAARGGNRFCAATLLSLDEGRPPSERLPVEDLATLSLTAYLAREPDTDAEEVFIFDQFEEVLSADPADRAAKLAFFTELGVLLDNPRRWALFILREDYLGALKPFLLLIPTRLAAMYRLDLLDPVEARRAMQEPARAAGGDFSDTAAEQLADDLRQTRVQRPDGSSESVLGQSIEPVQLQVVCYRLWARKMGGKRQEAGGRGQGTGSEGSITVEDLAQAGDVDTALRDYYAEQVAATARTSDVDERRIRDWVGENLITEAGLRGQMLRAPETTGGLTNMAIRGLVDAHLLRAEERRGATWYELAHDRLITPVRADNAVWFDANLSTLQRQARLWERANRPDGVLLHGDVLAKATHGLITSELNEVEQVFLRESQAHERQRRQSYATNLIVFALAIGALGLLYGMVQFFFQAESLAQRGVEQVIQLRTAKAEAVYHADMAHTAEAHAEAQARVSDSQRLAFAAQTQFRNNPETAMLLAYESSARDDNPVTEQTLRDAIDVVPWRPIVLSGHTSSVRSAVFSPDGTRILTASADHTARLWDTRGQPTTILKGHTAAITSAMFSPDGSRILTASDDDTVRLWDSSGQPIAILKGHTAAITSAMFSPDGTRILTASADHTVQLWDVAGTRLVTLSGHTNVVWSAVFSPTAPASSPPRLITRRDCGTQRAHHWSR